MSGLTATLKAPIGKYRVVGVDTFEGPCAEYLIGDFDTELEAKEMAVKRGGIMNPVYVYDDGGKNLFSAGCP